LTVIQNEEEKFERVLTQGLKQFEKVAKKGEISGIDAFHLFDTYGFPLELTEELAKEKNLKVDVEGFKEAFQKHREISRAGVEKKFGGVGKEASYEATKLHTATHLLHAALRKILGEHVKQMGSDITPQRLRFDFSHPKKLTKEEIKKVEDLVNQKIKEDLEVKKEEMELKEALKSGALAFFKEKYPEKVTVYSIGDFSKEICAGPHVKRTSELGHFKIEKEESAGSGIRRIRAILE
jgi:alanyl-tRNA synthetase